MKIKDNIKIIILLIIFFIISIISIYSTSKFNNITLVYKQILFYFIGAGFILVLSKVNYKKIFKLSVYIYLVNIILLVLVLLLGNAINGSRGWFSLNGIISLQPSEFMKIGLILFLATIINKYKNEKNHSLSEEFKLIIKTLIITLIPSILTFLQPDTGAIFTYFIILIVMLFISGIRYRWFVLLFILISGLISSILITYFTNQLLFIDIFGSNFFYRLDRLLFWKSGDGMQLNNSLIAIGASGLFGKGFNTIPLYFPEPQTDFIFASFTSCFGLLGSLILIICIIYFDLLLIKKAKQEKSTVLKLGICGLLASLIFQQIQNIAMTIGLLPITGITLPFISSGGSSLLSYMILLNLIITTHKRKININY